jgi:hypothetical protein
VTVIRVNLRDPRQGIPKSWRGSATPPHNDPAMERGDFAAEISRERNRAARK